jgi:hypothetical protein
MGERRKRESGVNLPLREKEEAKRSFIATLAETCRVDRSCKAAGISRVTAYQWRKQDAKFGVAWQEAVNVGISALEDEAHRRAFEGVDEPVYHLGNRCGKIRRYSDTLAIFLLKAHRPAVYRDNSRVEVTGEGGGPIQIDGTERAAKMAAIMAAAQKRKEHDPGTAS